LQYWKTVLEINEFSIENLHYYLRRQIAFWHFSAVFSVSARNYIIPPLIKKPILLKKSQKITKKILKSS